MKTPRSVWCFLLKLLKVHTEGQRAPCWQGSGLVFPSTINAENPICAQGFAILTPPQTPPDGGWWPCTRSALGGGSDPQLGSVRQAGAPRVLEPGIVSGSTRGARGSRRCPGPSGALQAPQPHSLQPPPSPFTPPAAPRSLPPPHFPLPPRQRRAGCCAFIAGLGAQGTGEPWGPPPTPHTGGERPGGDISAWRNPPLWDRAVRRGRGWSEGVLELLRTPVPAPPAPAHPGSCCTRSCG